MAYFKIDSYQRYEMDKHVSDIQSAIGILKIRKQELEDAIAAEKFIGSRHLLILSLDTTKTILADLEKQLKKALNIQ